MAQTFYQVDIGLGDCIMIGRVSADTATGKISFRSSGGDLYGSHGGHYVGRFSSEVEAEDAAREFIRSPDGRRRLNARWSYLYARTGG